MAENSNIQYNEDLIKYTQNQYKKEIKQLEKEIEYLKKIKKIKLLANYKTIFGENIFIIGNLTNNELKKCKYENTWVYEYKFQDDKPLYYRYVIQWKNSDDKNYQTKEDFKLDIRDIVEQLYKGTGGLILNDDGILIKNEIGVEFNKEKNKYKEENIEIKKIKFQLNKDYIEGEIYINGKIFNNWKNPEKLKKDKNNHLIYIYELKNEDNLEKSEYQEYKYLIEWKNGLKSIYETESVRKIEINNIKNQNNYEYNKEEKMLIIKDEPKFNYKEGTVFKKLEKNDIKKIRIIKKFNGKEIYVNGNIFNNWIEPKKCEIENDKCFWEYEIKQNDDYIIYKYLDIVDNKFIYENLQGNRMFKISDINCDGVGVYFDKNDSILVKFENFLKIEMIIEIIQINKLTTEEKLLIEGNYYDISVGNERKEVNKIDDETWKIELDEKLLKDNIFEYKYMKLTNDCYSWEKGNNRKINFKNLNINNNNQYTYELSKGILKIYDKNIIFE